MGTRSADRRVGDGKSEVRAFPRTYCLLSPVKKLPENRWDRVRQTRPANNTKCVAAAGVLSLTSVPVAALSVGPVYYKRRNVPEIAGKHTLFLLNQMTKSTILSLPLSLSLSPSLSPGGHLPTSATFKSLIRVVGSVSYSTTTPSWFAKMNLSLSIAGGAPAVAEDAIRWIDVPSSPSLR